MAYRLLADENIERATVTYLRQLGHDVEWVRDVSELGVGSTDDAIASYATDTDRLLLTQDDDFFTRPSRSAISSRVISIDMNGCIQQQCIKSSIFENSRFDNDKARSTCSVAYDGDGPAN